MKKNAIYKELAARHGWPKSKFLPLIFKKMVTPEQAKIMLQLTAQVEEIAEKLGMDKEKVEKHIQELFEKGLAFPTRKGWRLNRDVMALHDMTLSNPKYWNSYGGTEFADLWRAFEKVEWYPIMAPLITSLDVSPTRILPAWEAIKDNPGMLPYEDTREIYKAAESIVVVPCPCKRENYDRECKSPEEICIAFNRSAEYNLKRGVGRKLTLEEALALEQEARKHNLVSQSPNSTNVDTVLCHCHSCCCIGFQIFEGTSLLHKGLLGRSRYLAKVADTEKCTACQKCMETCQFEAVEMRKYPCITKWKAYINPDLCMGCGNCVIKCPKEGTIVMELVRPPEHILGKSENLYAPA